MDVYGETLSTLVATDVTLPQAADSKPRVFCHEFQGNPSSSV